MTESSYIESSLISFLKSDDSEVLCLKGKWGVGKTFFWNSILKKTNSAEIKKRRYAYVSLFGLNSISDLKLSIFENAVGSSAITQQPSIESVRKNIVEYSERASRKVFDWMGRLPIVGQFIQPFAALSFLTVRETIVCVDDIERKGAGLTIRDLMGLISDLKERRQCKVIVIMNSDAFTDATDTNDLAQFYEKIIDETFVFEPTAEQAVQIAFESNDVASSMISEFCIKLELGNIRLIRKIARTLRRVVPLISSFDHSILRQAAQTITLFVTSVYGNQDTSRVPPISFIIDHLSLNNRFGLGDENLSEGEEKWLAFLRAYGFTGVDRFDEALLNYVRHSKYNASEIQSAAQELAKAVEEARVQKLAADVWKTYYGSFDDNLSDILDAIRIATENLKHLSPGNLNAFVELLKGLGAADEAKLLINRYVRERSDTPRIFDLEENPFSDQIDDPDVRGAFSAQQPLMVDERDPVGVLIEVSNESGWSQKDINLLSALSADNFYNIFKMNPGEDLIRIIRGALHVGKHAGGSEQLLAISAKAKEALARIAEESPLNNQRVTRLLRNRR